MDPILLNSIISREKHNKQAQQDEARQAELFGHDHVTAMEMLEMPDT
jgi:hypothetical protein